MSDCAPGRTKHRFRFERASSAMTGATVERCTACGKIRVVKTKTDQEVLLRREA